MSSPVQLANYRIKKFSFDLLEDIEESDISEAEIGLNVDYEIFDDNADEAKHRIDLFVEITPPEESDSYLPFAAEVILQGIFVFQEEVDPEEQAYHLNISCTSMLYGVARNLIHQITGQTNYGCLAIPSVQFSEIAKQKAEDAEKKEENTSSQE